MKDHLRQLVESTPGDLLKTCVVREYLQARILQTLQESGVFVCWAFLGGTALRFLYSIPRYSEDLDFSTLESNEDPGFRSALGRIQTTLKAEGYPLRLKVNDRKTVASAFIRFPGLLHELELSPRPAQAFSIKIELDTNPPAGAIMETSLVRRHVTLNLHHYDKASLFAGKVHALLTRAWVKGRDLYDLIWYLADRTWPEPNLQLLNSALTQTGWDGPEITSRSWRGVLEDRLISVDWEKARADVLPFLERERDADLITFDNVMGLLGGPARRE